MICSPIPRVTFTMKILMIEDDPLTVTPYRIALQSREHQVVATDNRADRLKVYKEELDNRGWSKYNNLISLPFDAVVLIIECQKGMERSAKEILQLNPKQELSLRLHTYKILSKMQ